MFPGVISKANPSGDSTTDFNPQDKIISIHPLRIDILKLQDKEIPIIEGINLIVGKDGAFISPKDVIRNVSYTQDPKTSIKYMLPESNSSELCNINYDLFQGIPADGLSMQEGSENSWILSPAEGGGLFGRGLVKTRKANGDLWAIGNSMPMARGRSLGILVKIGVLRL